MYLHSSCVVFVIYESGPTSATDLCESREVSCRECRSLHARFASNTSKGEKPKSHGERSHLFALCSMLLHLLLLVVFTMTATAKSLKLFGFPGSSTTNRVRIALASETGTRLQQAARKGESFARNLTVCLRSNVLFRSSSPRAILDRA